jgi:hypothetical protein
VTELVKSSGFTESEWLRSMRTEVDARAGVLTLHDMLPELWLGFEASGGILADTRVMVEKLEVESVDAANMCAVSLVSHISDRAPGIVVEDSIDRRNKSEGCPCCHGTRRGDPFWRAKRSKARIGVGRTFNELAQP